jgi:hypothetical protein
VPRFWTNGTVAVAGTAYGLLLYVVNFLVLTPLVFTTFRMAKQPFEVVAHLVFGTLLSFVFFGSGVRRGEPVLADGGVSLGHDVLVAHGRDRGRGAQPVHDLAKRAAGGDGEGTAATGGLALPQAPESEPVRRELRCAAPRCLVKWCGCHRGESAHGAASGL